MKAQSELQKNHADGYWDDHGPSGYRRLRCDAVGRPPVKATDRQAAPGIPGIIKKNDYELASDWF